MNLDKYGEVINGEKTYVKIAESLKKGTPFFIGWYDEDFTHYDILFSYKCDGEGMHQRGIRNSDLFVSIMSIGSYGFKLEYPKATEYIGEKLFGGRTDISVEKVTQLINGVIEELKKG